MSIFKRVGVGSVFFLLLMFQVTTGFSFIVVNSIMDSVMINELGVPALLVGFILAADLVAQPFRAYFGSLSDRFGFKGRHRLPFIFLGGAVVALTYPLMVLVVEQMRDPNYHHAIGEVHNTGNYPIQPFWLIATILIFATNAIGLSMLGTISMSLIVDVTSEKIRGLVASVSWSFLIIGFIVGSIITKLVLPETEGRTFVYSSLYPVFFFIIPTAILVLVAMTCVGALIKEPNRPGPIARSQTHANFKQGLKVVSRNTQTRWFFFFLIAMMASMFMRDILTPAFGGNVYHLTLSERAGMQNSINGPTLVAMLAAGLVSLKYSKKILCSIGLGAAVFGMAIQAIAAFSFNVSSTAVNAYQSASEQFANNAISKDAFQLAQTDWNSAISGNKGIFVIGLIIMGIGLGISVPGLIGMMMDLTDPANAALYIGTWGIGQAIGEKLSNLIAGGARDIAYNAFHNNLGVGYGFIFALQAGIMVLAMWVLTHVDVTKFKRTLGIGTTASPQETPLSVATH